MKNTRMLLILALAIISGLAAGYSALRYLGDRPCPSRPPGTVRPFRWFWLGKISPSVPSWRSLT